MVLNRGEMKKKKMGRPRKRKSEAKTVLVQARITEEEKRVIDLHARLNDKTVSQLIQEALRNYFSQRDEKMKKVRAR